jgi:hypothetical protein
MTARKVLLQYDWENGVNFKAQQKVDDGEQQLIIETDENGCLASVWENIRKVIEINHKLIADTISAEMLAP